MQDSVKFQHTPLLYMVAFTPADGISLSTLRAGTLNLQLTNWTGVIHWEPGLLQ